MSISAIYIIMQIQPIEHHKVRATVDSVLEMKSISDR